MSVETFFVAVGVIAVVVLFTALRRWLETSPPADERYRPWYLPPVYATAPIACPHGRIDPVAWVAGHVGSHVRAATRPLLVELLRGPWNSSLRAALVRQAGEDPALVWALVAIARSTLWWAEEDDPARLAPQRALWLLGDLGAEDAIEALVPLLALDEPWGDRVQELLASQVFLRFGPAIVPRIADAMRDPDQPVEARGWLADVLERLAVRYPEDRDTIVAALTAVLDPNGDPLVNAQVALSLDHLEATDAYPTILALARAGAIETETFSTLEALIATLEEEAALEGEPTALETTTSSRPGTGVGFGFPA